jgi:nucleoside 2-deoxyribosyltransferase
MLSIYLAGKYEEYNHLREVKTQLESLGYRITSRWLTNPYKTSKTDEQYRGNALEDIEDIRRSDVFVMFNPKEAHNTGTGGRHFETGCAWALNKPVFLVGEKENVFHRLPEIQIVADFEELTRRLAGLRFDAVSGV